MVRIGLAMAVAATATCGGCNITPPDATYLCGSMDNACPTGLHCTCGLCVADDRHAACTFEMRFASSPMHVDEHEPFQLVLIPQTSDGEVSSYQGPVTLSSTWGDLSRDQVVLSQLTSDAASGGYQVDGLTLNRESQLQEGAYILAQAFGAVSASPMIDVTPLTFRVDPSYTLAHSPNSDGTPYITAVVPSGEAFYDSPSYNATLANGKPVTDKDGNVARSFLGANQFRIGADLDLAKQTPFAPAPCRKTCLDTTAIPRPVPSPDHAFDLAVRNVDPTIASPNSYFFIAGDDLTKLASNPLIELAKCDWCAKSSTVAGVSLVHLPKVGEVQDYWSLYFTTNFGAMDALSSTSKIGLADLHSDGLSTTTLFDDVVGTAVLEGDFINDAFVSRPEVLLDGRVLKMWFIAGAKNPNCNSPDAATIDYATSTNGTTWIRSTHYPNHAVMTATQINDPGASLLVPAAVTPKDGDLGAGLLLYFSTIRNTPAVNYPSAQLCLLNGSGRAVGLPGVR